MSNNNAQDDNQWIDIVLNTHNSYRVSSSPLTLCPILTSQAQNTANSLAQQNYLRHQDIPQNGYQNVAQGFLPWIYNNPGRPVELWIEDPVHALPITSNSVSKTGFGYATNGNHVFVVANYL